MDEFIMQLGTFTLALIMIVAPILTTLSYIYHWNAFIVVVLSCITIIDLFVLAFLIWNAK